MTITDRIFLRLSESDLSQKEFAIKIGANEKTVSAWKKNGTTPSADYIYPISQLLGVSLEYLLIGEDATVNNSITTGDITGNYNANITTASADNCTEFEKEFSSILSGEDRCAVPLVCGELGQGSAQYRPLHDKNIRPC